MSLNIKEVNDEKKWCFYYLCAVLNFARSEISHSYL